MCGTVSFSHVVSFAQLRGLAASHANVGRVSSVLNAIAFLLVLSSGVVGVHIWVLCVLMALFVKLLAHVSIVVGGGGILRVANAYGDAGSSIMSFSCVPVNVLAVSNRVYPLIS